MELHPPVRQGVRGGETRKQKGRQKGQVEDGRGSARSRKSQDDDASSVSSHGRAAEDSDFIYEASEDTNRKRRRQRKSPHSLPIKEFNFGDKAADWTSWIKKFENIVFAAEKPTSKEAHHKANTTWLPAYLNAQAHDIFITCRHKRNWTKLKRELEDTFDDPTIGQKWRTDLQAYKWDEIIPLHVYKGNVIKFVNKFDKEIRHNLEALRVNYFTRFVGGLPKDYKKFLDQQLYEDKQTIKHAVRAAQKFQGIKNNKQEKDRKKEVAAGGFQSSHSEDRLCVVEQGLRRLTTENNTFKNMLQNGNKTPPRTPSQDQWDNNSRRTAGFTPDAITFPMDGWSKDEDRDSCEDDSEEDCSDDHSEEDCSDENCESDDHYEDNDFSYSDDNSLSQ